MKNFGFSTMLFSLLLGASFAQAASGSFSLSYGGRLANANDEAEKGPVDLDVAFYRSAKSTEQLTVISKAGVPLDDGVFQVDLDLTASERSQVFGDGSQAVWVEITDKSHKKTYPRQMLTAVPFALASQSAQTIPVDGTTLTFGSDGKLKANIPAGSPASAISTKAVSAVAPTAGQFLVYDAGTDKWVGKDPFAAPFALPSSTTALETNLSSAANKGKLWYNSNTDEFRFNVNGALKTMTSKEYVDSKDAAFLKLDGSTPMSGPLSMGSNPLGLASVSTDPSGLSVSDKGKVWYNSTSGEIKYWNGSAAIALGAAGAGLGNLSGETGSTQTLSVGTAGNAPAWVHATNDHRLNIPLANAVGVTAGLLSNSDYSSFSNKANAGITISSGSGLTGGGDLSANRTLAIATDGVTSAHIADDSIVDADIKSTAAIADSKLATITSTGKVADSALSVNVTKLGSDINLASSEVSGTLPVANGGTGVSATPTNGQLLIGNGSGYTKAGLTAGTGITITSGEGSITVAATSDGTKLDVAGGNNMIGQFKAQAGSSANGPAISFAGDSNTGIYSATADTIQFSTAGTNRMTLGPNGTVSIGTSTIPTTVTVLSQRFDSAGSGLVSTTKSDIFTQLSGNSNAVFVGSSSSASHNSSFAINTGGAIVGSQSDSSANSTGTISALTGAQTSATNGGAGTAALVTGLQAAAVNSGTGTTTTAVGLETKISATAGTITNAYGIKIPAASPTGGTTISSYKGLFVDGSGASGNNYAIFSPNGLVYFQGNVGIGTWTPSAPLEVVGPIKSNTGFAIGASSPKKMVSAQINPPSTVNYSDGGIVSSVSATSGVVTVSIVASTFSMNPICTCSIVGAGGQCSIGAINIGSNPQTIVVNTANPAGTATNMQFNLICIGI